jgi:hypothetical protein
MLYAFGFERVGVVVSDLYFVDPHPSEGQEGPERGVRLEVRMLQRGELKGSIYSAQPIAVEDPIWRVDLLESVAGPAGSFDRTHHHPRFTGWEPGRRCYLEDLSADPLGWLGNRLADLDGVFDEAGVDSAAADGDGARLREAVPEILAAVQRLLDKVRAGDRGGLPPADEAVGARVGWL